MSLMINNDMKEVIPKFSIDLYFSEDVTYVIEMYIKVY